MTGNRPAAAWVCSTGGVIRGFMASGHAEILLLISAGMLAVFANLPERRRAHLEARIRTEFDYIVGSR